MFRARAGEVLPGWKVKERRAEGGGAGGRPRVWKGEGHHPVHLWKVMDLGM